MWIVLALVAFGVSVVLCICVLLPKDGFGTKTIPPSSD